jgi:hypothetical protein
MNRRSIIKSGIGTLMSMVGYMLFGNIRNNTLEFIPIVEYCSDESNIELFCAIFDFSVIFYHLYRIVKKSRMNNSYYMIDEEEN